MLVVRKMKKTYSNKNLKLDALFDGGEIKKLFMFSTFLEGHNCKQE